MQKPNLYFYANNRHIYDIKVFNCACIGDMVMINIVIYCACMGGMIIIDRNDILHEQ